jgi:hypothetical protein
MNYSAARQKGEILKKIYQVTEDAWRKEKQIDG